MVALRAYQTDLIDRVRTRLKEGLRRVLVQAPCGAGKTHISSEIVALSYQLGKRSLFLADRRLLISQKSDRLKLFGVPHGVLMAGENTSVGQLVQVASRDTLLSRAVKRRWMELPEADLVIVDEAHGWMADESKALLGRYPDAVILGLTATPARSDGRGMAPFWQALECTVPVSQLVADGFVCRVRCYSPAVTKSGRIKKGLCGCPVQHWKLHAEGRPTVLFTTKVSHSLAVASEFNQAGIAAEHMDAHTPDDQRLAIRERVRSGKTKILCNVGIVNQGADIPELSCCILYRTAGSYVFYAQAVGRIMRPAPGKEDGVLLDHSGAVLRHGFPDEDVKWDLSESDTVDSRIKKDKEEGNRRLPVVCEGCHLIYSGQWACPNCGWVPKRRTTAAERRHEMLTRVDRHGQELTEQEMVERRRRYWMECLAQCARMGRAATVAAAMYKRVYKVYPEHDLRHHCHRHIPVGSQWYRQVSDLYPEFAPRRRATR